MQLFLRSKGNRTWLNLSPTEIVLNTRSSYKCANSKSHCRKYEVKGSPKDNLHTLASLFYDPIW